MSTIVVVKKDGWVAVGADTLTKYGYEKESADYIVNHSKINRIKQDTYIAHAGHASWDLIIDSYLNGFDHIPSLNSRIEIFEFSRRMHKALLSDYHLNPKLNHNTPFGSSRATWLIANPYGIFGLSQLRAVQEYSRFHAFGSGREYAMGGMQAVYEIEGKRDGNVEGSGVENSAESIARIGLTAACEFDENSDQPLEIHTFRVAARRPPAPRKRWQFWKPR